MKFAQVQQNRVAQYLYRVLTRMELEGSGLLHSIIISITLLRSQLVCCYVPPSSRWLLTQIDELFDLVAYSCVRRTSHNRWTAGSEAIARCSFTII